MHTQVCTQNVTFVHVRLCVCAYVVVDDDECEGCMHRGACMYVHVCMYMQVFECVEKIVTLLNCM